MARGQGSKEEMKAEEKKQEAAKTEQMPLQYDVKIGSIRPEGNIRATASVNINQAFAIRNVKIIEGSKGLFISMPCYKAGNGEYKDICFPITAEARQQLSNAVLNAYEQVLMQGQSSVQKAGGQEQAPEGQTMQMAGM